MPHYRRNVRFIVFLILPIISFLLGWSFNQKYSTEKHVPYEIKKEEAAKKEETKNNILQNTIKIPISFKTDPKDVDLSPLWEAWNTVEANFLYQDRFKTKDQLNGIIKGLIGSLDDPYTVYMTAEESDEFDKSISGEFEGIGAEIGIKKEQLTVISPLKGSPAEQAGLRPGDVIFKVDGEPTFGMSVLDAVVKIRGPKGEKVVLEIIRKGESKPIEITIVRDNIIVNNLEWTIRDEIAVLEISQFGTDLVKEFRSAIQQILLENPKGIVIDLRNNGGGLLDACIEIANEFFDSQVIVKTKGRKIANSENFVSNEGGAFLDVPLIVLVNKGSASASEIFAGAVLDNKRGVVLGETTFGKGSVQNVIPLSNGASLKVTIAEWLTPDGNSIHEVGVSPDETIEKTKEDFDNDRDPVLARALELLAAPEEVQNIIKNRGKTEVAPASVEAEAPTETPLEEDLDEEEPVEQP